MNKSHTLVRLVSLVGLLFLSAFGLFAQTVTVSATDPRHETQDQQTIEVLWSGILSGSTSVAEWTVQIGGVNVTTVGVLVGAPSNKHVAVTFDATPVNGAGVPFVKPGQVLTIKYTNILGTLKVGGVNAISMGAFAPSRNNWTGDCSDIQFFQQGIIPLKQPDVCIPVVEDFTQFQFYFSLRVRNSSLWLGLGSAFNVINWGDGGPNENVPAYQSDPVGTANLTYIDPLALAGSPAVVLTTRPTHTYPNSTTPPGPPTQCGWSATITPALNLMAFTGCVGFTQTKLFANYDTDNKNTGTLNLPPSPLPTSRLVCLGTNVNMQFSDNTTLNCQLAVENRAPNQIKRAIRISYGSTSYAAPVGNIPDIWVTLPAAVFGVVPPVNITNNNATGTFTGAAPYFPTNIGPADGNGVITISAPVTIANAPTLLKYMGTITTTDPSLQQIGQRFYIKLEYWDICNAYNALVPATLLLAESIENYVEIVGRPVPLTTAGLSLCFTTPNSTAFNFSTNTSIVPTAVNWYKDLASVGTATKMANGVANLNFPAASYGAQGGIGGAFTVNNTNGRYMSVWATQVDNSGGISCESDPVEVVIVQQPDIRLPSAVPPGPIAVNAITPAGNVCNGSSVVYTESTAPPNRIIPANTSTNLTPPPATRPGAITIPTQFTWSTAFPATVTIAPIVGNSPTITYSIGAGAFGGLPSLTNNISTALQYRPGTLTTVTSPLPVRPVPFTIAPYSINRQLCTAGTTDLSVTVFTPPVGGTASPLTQTICESGPPLITPISVPTVGVGKFLGTLIGWERSTNGGAFSPDGTMGIANPVTPAVPIVGGLPTTYKFHAIIQNGPCVPNAFSSDVTVVVNPTPATPTITPSGPTTFCFGGSVTLTSSNVNAATYQWFKGGVAVAGATAQTYLINTVAQSGSYTVQTFGVGPTACPGLVSAPLVITVNPLPTASNPTGGGAVCSGTPAPDITWTLTGTPPFDFTITRSVEGPLVVVGHPAMTYTIVAPLPPATQTYQITSLVDNNGCVATSMGGTATVSVTLTPPPSVQSFNATAAVCDAGGATNPPDAILDLLPDLVQTYDISFNINGTPFTQLAVPSNASGQITLAPLYAVWGSVPGSYVITVTALKNTVTQCAGAVPFSSTPLVVNPRPAAPTVPVGSTYCSTGAPSAISVAIPGVNLTIDWYNVAAGGVVLAGGTGTVSFNPPVTGATTTYFAETRNTVTGCVSPTRTSVVSTIDNAVAVAAAGPDQLTLTSCTPTPTLAATAVAGGVGAWSIPGKVAYFQNFTNFANGTTRSSAINGWTIDTSNPNAFPQQPPGGYFEVRNAPANPRFEAQNTNGNKGAGGPNQGEVVWFSSVADISGIASVTATVDVINVSAGLGAPDDNVGVFYKLNGGAEIAFTVNGSLPGNFANSTASVSGLAGATLQVVVRIRNDAAANTVAIDNVIIRDATAAAITFADANSPTTTITGLPSPAAGTPALSSTLRWTASSLLGACPNTFDDVTITINPAPLVLAAQTASVCSGSAVNYEIKLSPLNFPAGSTLTWPDPDAGGPGTAKTINADPAGTFHITDVFTNTSGANTTVTYSVTPRTTVGAGCNGAPVNVVVTIRPAPVVAAGQTKQICSNQPVNYKILLAPAGLPATTRFTWPAPTMSSGPAQGTGNPSGPAGELQSTSPHLNDVLINNGAAPITATYNITPFDGTCFGATVPVVITINPLPIANPIVGQAAVCIGPTTVLYQVTPNAGSTYNWVVPAPFVKFGGGAATDFFVLVQFPVVGVGSVTMTETNSFGCVGSVNTFPVTASAAPGVFAIAGLDPVCQNQTGVTYSVPGGSFNATSTYNWTASGASIVSAASGVGLGTITVDFGLALSAVISVSEVSPSGCSSATPITKTVTVGTTPVMTSANSQGICSGSATTLVFTANPASTFGWKITSITGAITSTVAGFGVGKTGIGDLSATFTGATALTNTSAAVGSVSFDVTPTSSCAGTTQSVVITVNPKPAISNQSPAICSGSAFTIAPVDGVPTAATIVPFATSYTWAAPVVTGGVTGGSAQAGQGSISQTLTNPTNIPQTATYTVTPTSGTAGSCVGSNFTVTVSVNPKPIIGNQTATICSGGTFAITPLDASPATIVPAGTTYTWPAPVVTGGVTGGSAQAVGLNSISQTLTNPTNVPQTALYTITPTSGAAGACVGATFTITATVNPKPVIGNQAPSICSGSAFTVTPLDASPATIVPAGTTYTWAAPVVTGGITGSSAQAVGLPSISQTLTNPTNVNQTATYTVLPTSGAAGACVGATFTITVTVNPKPVIPAQVASICSGTAFSITPANGVPTAATIVPAGTLYTWAVPVVTGGVTGGSAQAIGLASISQTLTNPTNVPQTATYTVTPTSGASGSCVGATFTIAVTVNPAPVIPAQTATVCSGTVFTITPTNGTPTAATIVPAGTTYSWAAPVVTGGITGSSAQAGQATISQTLTNPTNITQTATYTVTPTSGAAGACVGAAFTVTVTVHPKPVIPVQTATVCSGSAFTISPIDGAPTPATIVPAGTTYSWAAPVVTGAMTGGSAQASQASISQILTNPTNTPQTAAYTVIPTSGAAGACVGSNFTVTVTVNPKPVIPVQTAIICSGTAFTITPADGVPTSSTIVPAGTTYSWPAPVVTGGITGGSAQAGLASISQTLTNPTNSVQTATYTVTPTSGAAGACVGTNFTITVTVNPKPVIPVQTATICSGVSFTISPSDGVPTSATIVPGGTTYTWAAPVVTGGITGGSAQAGQASISQILTNPTNAVQTATYTVTPTSGASGACVGANFTITVTVNPKPVIANQAVSICSGNAFTIAPTNGVPTAATIVPAGTTYTWPAPVLTGGITGSSAQVSQASISQTLTNPTNLVQTATYTVTPTSGAAGACPGAIFTVTVTVNPQPIIPAQTTSICSGTSFTISPANGVPTAATIVPGGTTYTWPAPAVTGGITGGSAQAVGQPNISQTLINPTNSSQTATYTVTPTSGAAGACVGATFTITVTVNPIPVIANRVSTICSGTAFSITPTDGVPTAATIVPGGTTYTWAAPVVTGGITGGSAQAGQASISQTLTNPTNIAQTATYTVTPTSGVSGACVGSNFTVTVTVSPQPAIPAQTATICSGATFTVSPTNGLPTAATIVPAGTTYSWPAPVVTGGITGGSAQAGQASVSQTLTNPTSTAQIATYTVTPVSGACTGANFTVLVTVNPKPAIPAQTATICSGASFTVTPADGVPTAATIVPGGTTYTWAAPVVTGGITGGSAQAVGQPSISQTLNNPTNTLQTATYTVTPTSGGGACIGATFTVTVTVNPKPAVPAQIATICSTGTFSITPANGVPTAATIVPGGTTYTWGAPVVTGGITGGSAQAVGQPNISQTLTNPTNVVQTATYTVTPTSGAAGACVGSTFTVTVTVNPQPVIPAQTVSICSGAAFSINPANGVPTVATVVPAATTYTWGAPVVTGGITGGSAQAVGQPLVSQTLTNPTNLVQTATYTVTPTSGAAGGCIGIPFTITVTVNPKPVIPAQVITVCSGSVFTISPADGVPTAATIVPAGTTYAWAAPVVTGGMTGGSAQAGQASVSQTLTNPTNTAQTATYTVTPTSGASGSCVGSNFTVTVTVNPQPSIPAQTSTICSGAVFTVSPANGSPTAATIVPAGTAYSWPAPVVTGGITGGSAQAGQASVSQTLTNPTSSVQIANYTVTPLSGACTGATFTVLVTVNPKPSIPAQTAIICSGSTFTVTPVDGVPSAATIVPGGTTYTWAAPVVTGGITGGSAQVVGQPSISQTLTNPTNTLQTATYTVTPTSGVGACSGPTFTVTVTVNPKPVIPALTSTICSGSTFTINPTNGVPTAATIVPAGTTYSWSAPVVTGGVTGGSAQTAQANISQTLVNPTNSVQTATYVVTPTSGAAGACVGSNFTITVTVNPQPVVPAQTATICSATVFTVSPVNAAPTTIVPAGTTYAWPAPVVTGGITGGSAQAAQPNISQTLTNPTSSVQTATYTVTPTSGAAGACVGATFTVTVTVNPKPIIPAQVATICSGTAFTVSPVDGGANVVPTGTTYTWTAPVVTGGITGGTAQPVGQPSVSQTLNNPSNVAQTATYTVTPTSGAAGACVGTPFSIIVTVNPKPVAQALSQITRCSGAAINFNLQDIINNVAPFAGGNSVPSTFAYTVVSDFPLDLAPAVFPGTFDRVVASALPISQTFSNYSNHDVTLTYTVTPFSNVGNCQGAPFTFKVFYHPEPVGANFTEPNCNTSLNHSIQTQITSGLTSRFTYVVASSDEIAVPTQLPTSKNRVVASTAFITDSYTNLSGSPVTVTYTITAFNDAFPACAGAATFTYTVTISPKPVGVTDTKPSICSDVAFTVDPQLNINPAVASTFAWTATYDGAPIAPGTGVINATFTNTSAAVKNAVYTITPTAQGSGCAGLPFTITIPINPEPVMDPVLATPSAVCSDNVNSANPINVILNTVLPNAAASYNITSRVLDAGLIFNSGAAIPGVFVASGAGTSNAIQNDKFSNTTAAQLKVVYTITPKSAAGCNGDVFTITMRINPEPVVSTALNNTVCSRDISNITLSTNGTSVGAATYRLISVVVPAGVTADVSNTPVNTTGSPTLIKNDKYTNITAGQLTVIYEVRGISPGGCLGLSRFINLAINPAPVLNPALATPPAPACSGLPSGVTLSVDPGPPTPSVAAVSYNIISIVFPGLTADPGNTAVGNGKPANAIFNDIYINATNGPLTVTYSISPVSAAGCVGPIGTVVLNIGPSPDLANNLNKTVCSGSASGINLSIANAVAMGDYNLISITPQAGLVGNVGNVTAGPNKAANALALDIFTNPTNGVLTVTYRISPRSAINCFGPAEDVILSVEPTVTATPAPLNSTVCSNSGSTTNPTNITLTSPTVPSAGVITFNYSATVTSGSSTSGFIPSLSNLAQGYIIQDNIVNSSNAVSVVTYTITPVANGARGGLGCTGTGVPVTVSVEPKPKLVATPTFKTVCEGVSPAISLTSPTIPSAGGVEFLLVTAVATGGVTGASANGTIFANGSTIIDILSNPTATAQTVTYTLRPRMTAGACIGDDVIVTVTVNPRPVITASAQAPICSGGQVDITLTPDVLATVSTWTVAASANITGAGPGAGDRIFSVLFNNGTAVETVTYTITPQASGCAGTPLIIPVTVNPVPKVIAPATKIVCHGATLTVPLTSTIDPLPVTYTWTVSPNAIGVPLAGSGPTISQAMTNTQGFQETLTYSIVATGPGGCDNSFSPKLMIVTVSPQITAGFLNSPSPDFICKGSTEYLIFQFGGSPLFNFTYNKGGAPIVVPNKGNVVVIQDIPLVNTTYTITSVTDGLGCTAPFNVPFVVNVGDTDPNYSIISPLATCSPNRVSFQYNQVAGTIYTWRFGDSADSTYTAATTVANKVIKHTYTNLSPTSTLNYPVTMQTELPLPFPGCFKTTPPKTVTIYPNIIANILSDKTEICSGESILFSNQSVGATSQTWSYKVSGAPPASELPMGNSININFTFTNSTAANPILYDVIYRGTNGNCPTPDQVITIKVYRTVVAGYNEGVVPLYVNGESNVTYTNTSTPVDAAFTYDWTFGADATPASFTGPVPPVVKYVRPGPKTVTLTASNAARPICKSTFEKTININMPPLIAIFDVDPKESCYPSVISVSTDPAKTQITGDTNDWRVFDDNGRVVGTSTGATPVFPIPAAGKYTITLKTSNSITGQVAIAPSKKVEVYGKPFTSFDVRPDVVYIPDTELSTFNFSTGANQYSWDFGDGDVIAGNSGDNVSPGTNNGRTSGTIEEPKHIYKVEGSYNLTLIAKYDHGNNIVCADTLAHQVLAKQGGIAKVPNAFTPNPSGPSGGSGPTGTGGTGSFNDVFLPYVKGVEEFNLQIYDRWGNLIFESNDQRVGWDGYDKDGRILPAGVYVYKLTLRLSDGQRSTQIGDVTMIR